MTFDFHGCLARGNGNQGESYIIILRKPEEGIKIFGCEGSKPKPQLFLVPSDGPPQVSNSDRDIVPKIKAFSAPHD